MSNFKPKKLKHCVAYRNVIKKWTKYRLAFVLNINSSNALVKLILETSFYWREHWIFFFFDSA